MKKMLAALALSVCPLIAQAQSYGPYPEETYTTCGSPLDQTAVVLIHGGAWFSGRADAADILKLCNYLGLHRVYVVAIDYRASTVAPWPAQLQDAQLAFRWMRKNVKAKRVGVVGLSAGGHIALSMAFQRPVQYAGSDELSEASMLTGMTSHPDFVVDVSGPTDLTQDGLLPVGVAALTNGLRMSTHAAEAFASPIAHITTATSPLLILHGTEDATVPVSQSDDLVLALSQAGVVGVVTNSQTGGVDAPWATVIYDRHPGGHVFGGASLGPMYAEILKFAKGN